MVIDKLLVTVIGIALIILIAWFFFAGQKIGEKPMSHDHKM